VSVGVSDRGSTIERRALRWSVWALLLPALAPVASFHPPFQDWGGHVGVVGAMLHPELAARFVEQQRALGPNGALYLLIFGLAQVLPPRLALALVLALVLAGIGLAARWLCRAAGADPGLALLALPVAFARPTYNGFIPNVAATAMLIAGLAAYLSHRRDGKHRDLALQVILQIGIAAMHTFVALASFGLIALWAAMDLRRAPRAAVAGLAAVASGAVVLFALLGDGGSGAIDAILAADRGRVASDFWTWLVAFREGLISDDLLQIAWLAPMTASIALQRRWDEPKIRLAAALIATLVAFVLVPMAVGPPVSWWGARGRLPAIAVLLALPLLSIDRLRPLVAAAKSVAVAIAIYSLVELAIWERTVMSGFGETIASLPPGRALSVLWYDVDPERRFPGAPLGHAGGWYVFERGGGSAQTFFEVEGAPGIATAALPFLSVRPIPGPPWGMAELFDWTEHAPGVELFLVRTRDDAPTAPFYGGQLELLEPSDRSGAWRYWTR
jgi:hypothetical protein